MPNGWQRVVRLAFRGGVSAGLLLVLGLGSTPRTAFAQTGAATAEIRGRIFLAGDTMSLGGAEVEVVGTSIRFAARRDGQYQLRGVPLGRHEIRVRLIGLSSRTIVLDIDEPGVHVRDIAMSRLPNTLSEVVINGIRRTVPPRFDDVYRRMSTANGVFFTREDIASLKPHDILGLMQHVPMAHVNNRGVWFARCVGHGASIGQLGKLQIYIDGFRVTRGERNSTDEQLEVLSRVVPSQIQAVEVYSSSNRIPAEFLEDACAVIAIWTR